MLSMAALVCLSKHSAYLSPYKVWIICATLFVATCLIRWRYKRLPGNTSPRQRAPSGVRLSPSPQICRHFRLSDIIDPVLYSTSLAIDMRYPRRGEVSPPQNTTHISPPPKTRQPYEAFLILDVEATCQLGTDFNFPNEIIEFPVCLMKWEKNSDGNAASRLEIVDEFRRFVKPTWRPILSDFCKGLTGITQEQVDSAPLFSAVMVEFQHFMVKHGLIDGETGERLVRFCWCSDGPFDVRDFVVKQCFISKIPMPSWLQGDILDIRTTVLEWLHSTQVEAANQGARAHDWNNPGRRSLNIPAQLKVLGLPRFEGRHHSGIDDSRNLTKVVAELARRDVCLRPNTTIQPNRRWRWMGKHGQILEEYCLT